MSLRQHIDVLSKLLGRTGWFWLCFAILASSVLAMSDYGIALLIQVLLKSLGLADDSVQLGGWIGSMEISPFYLLLGLMLVGLMRGLGQFGVYQGGDLVHEMVNTRLRLLSAYEILRSPSQDFIAASTTNTYVGEIFPKAAMFVYYAVTMLTMFLQCVIYLLAMLYTAWQEALIGIIGAAIIGVVVLKINRFVRRAAAGIPGEQKALITGIQRIASNWLVVKAFRTADIEHAGLIERNRNYYRHFVRAKTLGNIGAVTPLIAGVLLLIAIIYMSVTFFKSPSLDLIACIYLFGRFTLTAGKLAKGFGLLGSLSAHYLMAARYISGFERSVVEEATSSIATISSMGLVKPQPPQRQQDSSTSVVKSGQDPAPAPAIQIDDLAFTYGEGTTAVLEGLSLSIQPGEQVGIVGRSGSGKSTLLGLLCGVLLPTRGHVKIDGASPELYFQEYPYRLGYVGSEPYLVEGSIKDNLDYGAVNKYKDQQYREVLESVHLLDFVDSQEQGIGYIIDESGGGLSAGQKQRVSLARSLLRNPGILILDEVTSNLDNELETEIVSVLNKLKGICTVIIVSHRAGALTYADRVYELDSHGKLQPAKNETQIA